MFGYLFPATFRIDQHNKFDACQQSKMTALDFLRKLQDITDTVGDLSDYDIILAFWRRCFSYLNSELAKTRFESDQILLVELQSAVIRLEIAHNISESAKKHTEQGPAKSNSCPKSFEMKDHTKPDASNGKDISRSNFKKKESRPDRKSTSKTQILPV